MKGQSGYRGFASQEEYHEHKRAMLEHDAWEEEEAKKAALDRGDPWPPPDVEDRSWLDEAYREPPRHPSGRPMKVNEV